MPYTRVQAVERGLRLPRGATTLAQTGVKSLYTVVGGAIRVISLQGFVTTAIQAQANATKIQAKATGQTAVDMCATGDINGLALGQAVGITGVAATGLQMGWAILGTTTPWIVLPGTIDMNCAASNTGAFSWVLSWEPISPGCFVQLS
jgi:hypothetical protein